MLRAVFFFWLLSLSNIFVFEVERQQFLRSTRGVLISEVFGILFSVEVETETGLKYMSNALLQYEKLRKQSFACTHNYVY